MPLDIEIHKAKLENVNLGYEGSGDGQISRLDLKLVFTASSEILPTIVDVSVKDQNIFWVGGNLIGGLGLMDITHEWSHNELRFGAIDSPFNESEETCLVAENVMVKNGKIKPMPNNLIEVTLTAQIREPTPLQYKLCGNFQKREGGLVAPGSLQINISKIKPKLRMRPYGFAVSGLHPLATPMPAA